MLKQGAAFNLLASLAISLLATVADAANNFCMRIDHQSTIKNGKLYVDGGIEALVGRQDDGPIEDTLKLGYNTQLTEIDMTSSWDWEHNISIAVKNKIPNPWTGIEPPLVVRGALFPGSSQDTNIYLYGGTTTYLNTSLPTLEKPTSSQYALWSFDTVNGSWVPYDVTSDVPNRPAGGAYAEASDRGLAFYLNGFVNEEETDGIGNTSSFLRYLDGLIMIDTQSHTATNFSTASLRRFPRAKGSMVYIPDEGSQGILMTMGGVTKPSNDNNASDEGDFVTFDQIDFLDISSLVDDKRNTSWYTQKTIGDIPEGRTDFCLVTASAKDNSSHSIYLYGGKGSNEEYDEVFVLSIPSFTWKKVYQGNSPRYGHTCHLVGNRQMLTVGGTASESLLSGCDPERASVSIFDLTELEWGSVYNHFAADYQVPEVIYNIIGGDANGNACMKAPSVGFNTPEIADIFYKPDTREHEGLSARTISGIVVGSVGGAGLILGILFFLLRGKKKEEHIEDKEGKGDISPQTDEKDYAYISSSWRNDDELNVKTPDARDKERALPAEQLPGDQSPDEMEMNTKHGHRPPTEQ